ncbi:MAG TPA: hypothetical protein VEK15_20515 [Vicinamibacteria bacterium]|nr:hypothetical protein [Vicinamibacteria bacterium]
MAGFVHTLVAEVLAVGPLTFTLIDDEGANVELGLTEYVIPNNGKVFQVQAVDGSNSAGAFSYRVNYRADSGVVRLIDVVSPSAGEVLKTFAVEAPLLEVKGNGTRAIRAEAIVAGGATPDGTLTIIIVERET